MTKNTWPAQSFKLHLPQRSIMGVWSKLDPTPINNYKIKNSWRYSHDWTIKSWFSAHVIGKRKPATSEDGVVNSKHRSHALRLRERSVNSSSFLGSARLCEWRASQKQCKWCKWWRIVCQSVSHVPFPHEKIKTEIPVFWKGKRQKKIDI